MSRKFRLTRYFATYRDKAKVIFTYFQIVSQQVGGCITVPWPSGYGAIIRKLEFLSLSFVPYFSVSCLFPRTNFYTAPLTSTAGPIVVGSAILAFYLARRKRDTSSDKSQLQTKAASYALAVSYLAFPNGLLITFRAFACDCGVWRWPKVSEVRLFLQLHGGRLRIWVADSQCA